MAKLKIVLYQPQQVNQELGQFTSYDMLPLEMLHVAALPVKDGHEVIVIDASLYSHQEAHRRALDACQGAHIFGTTAILGFMVADGHRIAQQVRARFPALRIIAGGWFASCLPEAYLSTGVYDAVALGQGELTFRDFVQAVESGADLSGVAGLALWRENKVIQTEHRPVVGWEQLPNAAWHLIDIEPYRERQMRPGAREARNRMPSPPSAGKRGNYFGISYFSSYGCPEPCSFCCSPLVTNRRWKAMPAARMLDDLQDLKQRWGFEVVRFQDANWGVAEKRVREFCEGMQERNLRFEWSTTFEVNNILRYDRSTLDLLRDTGMYVACVGAETALPDMMERVGKPIGEGDTLAAARLMHERGMVTSLTYIIGYPGETEASMLATLDQARTILHECPSVSAHVYPYRPIPGSQEYERAINEHGYRPPVDLESWGQLLEYHVMDTWKDNIPESVQRRWRLYYQYASFKHGLVRPKRGLIEKIADWRIKTGDYRLPVELKAFYLFDKLFGWGSHKEDEKQTWIMAAENERVTMVDSAAQAKTGAAQ
jgi:anaerobic magnesium-protoporphyrin IX monomethyl ester cyclase